MSEDNAATPAVDALVDSMMQSHGQLALIVDHMQRWSAQGRCAGAKPIPEVLRGILQSALAGLPEHHGLDDVASAAQMLAAATEVVGEEIYLVD